MPLLLPSAGFAKEKIQLQIAAFDPAQLLQLVAH
jgi:hypothetical protein